MATRGLRALLGISVVALGAVAANACAAIVGFESLVYEGDARSDGTDVDAADVGPLPGNDAGPDVDTGNDAACAHDFCDDFEGVATPDKRWTGKEVVGTGNLMLVVEDGGTNTVMRSFIDRPDAGEPPPHIARVSLQGDAATQPGGTTPKIRLAFRLKVEAADSPFTGIGFIVLGSAPTSEDVLVIELELNAGDKSKLDVFIREIYSTDAGQVVGGKLSSLAIPVRKWTEVELQVNARPPGVSGGATLTIDGKSDSYTIVSNSRASYLRVDVGHGFGGGSGTTFTSFIDDVRIDYK